MTSRQFAKLILELRAMLDGAVVIHSSQAEAERVFQAVLAVVRKTASVKKGSRIGRSRVKR